MKFAPVLLAAACAFHASASATPHIKAAGTAYAEGRDAEKQHQWDRAVACFRKAIAIEPTYDDARQALIDVEMEAGNRLEAAKVIIELLQIEPNALRYRVLLGQILLEQKQTQRALAQFSLALQQSPSDADALLGFAEAAKQSGMNDRAAQALESGRKYHPTDTRFRPDPHHS